MLVKLRDKRSYLLHIKRGALQGSTMGPLLSNGFINDIFVSSSDINIYDYTDDNSISFAGSFVNVMEDPLIMKLPLYNGMVQK